VLNFATWDEARQVLRLERAGKGLLRLDGGLQGDFSLLFFGFGGWQRDGLG
jgi:hypothetical protein